MTPAGAGPAPPPLPGNCVPIPQVTAQVRDVNGGGTWTIATHVVQGLDLDGHGSPVVLVPGARDGANQYSLWWRLFIQRGSCGHELGVVVGTEDPALEPGEAYGLRNFSMVAPVPGGVDPELQGIGATVYTFDEVLYVGGATDYR